MAAGGMIGYTPTAGWGRFRAILRGAQFTAALEKNIGMATRFNALQVQKAIRQNIKHAASTPNAALTILIKGSSKPLVDHGDLFQAISHQIITPYSAFVGVLKKENDEHVTDLIKTLHDGGTIPVTPAMRGLFFYLWKLTTGALTRDKVTEGRLTEIYDRIEGTGKIIYPLKDTTTAIHIRPRPFMKEVFDDKEIAKYCKINWTKAIDSAIKG